MRLLALSLIAVILCGIAKAQTPLCITGAIHNPTRKINSDSILKVISNFNPTIILYEADTILDLRNNLKGIDGGTTNEFIAINKYLKIKPATTILPFDWTGKQKFREQNNYWPRIDSMNKAINNLLDSGKPSQLSMTIIESLTDFSELNNLFLKEDLFTLNQPYLRRIIELKTKWEYQKLIEMADAEDSLKNIKSNIQLGFSYWELRNKNMAANILSIIKNNPNNRILVLVGNNHKYFLYNELANKQKEYLFMLTEFWQK